MSSIDDRGSSDPLIGALLEGKYRVQHRLGSGGMGTVYLAVDTGIDRPVAIKILNEVQSSDATALQRFQREAISMKSLNHINVVRLNAVGFHENRNFLVLEYVEGDTLAQLLKARGTLPLKECLSIWQQIIAGVRHAHENGVLHRDLKPNNILVTKQSGSDRVVVKVMDFGVARLLDEASQKLTQTGSFIGTAPYMSPEQLAGVKTNEASDQYSIGCLMYECLFGRPPFSGDTFFAIALAHSSDELQVPQRTADGVEVPTPMVQCLTKALAKTPEGRFASLAKLSEMLSRIERNPNLSLPAEELLQVSKPEKRQRKQSKPVIAAVLLVLGLAAMSYLWIQRETGLRDLRRQLTLAKECAQQENYLKAEQHIEGAFSLAKAKGISESEITDTVYAICSSAFRDWRNVPRQQWTSVGRITLHTVKLLHEREGEDVNAMRLVVKAFERLATGSEHGKLPINDTTPIVEELLDNSVVNDDYSRLWHQPVLTSYSSDLGKLAHGYVLAAHKPGLDAETQHKYLLTAQGRLLKALWLGEKDYIRAPLTQQLEQNEWLGDVHTQLGKHAEAKKNYDEMRRLRKLLMKDALIRSFRCTIGGACAFTEVFLVRS